MIFGDGDSPTCGDGARVSDGSCGERECDGGENS